MKKKYAGNLENIAWMENLLAAWKEFVPGKRGKRDVQEFQLRLMDNLFALHYDLIHHTYRHGSYQAFNISDPKPRNIHKVTVRDRLLHHAIYRQLYPFFDRTFIADSFSCRNEKGMHAAMNRFRRFAYAASKNHTRTCWVLKCDIRKFFANIDHAALIDILRSYISDGKIIGLLEEVVGSFSSAPGVGLPLGNLTSQLFVNIYMNEFDQFVKRRIKAKYYLRYADDFVLLSDSRAWLETQIPIIEKFLSEKLRLAIHPQKIFIKTLASGVDFLGWVHFPGHRVLRTTTKRRMIRRMGEVKSAESLNSYIGLLGHGNAHKLRSELSEKFQIT